jgi:hypothetical protein
LVATIIDSNIPNTNYSIPRYFDGKWTILSICLKIYLVNMYQTLLLILQIISKLQHQMLDVSYKISENKYFLQTQLIQSYETFNSKTIDKYIVSDNNNI